MTKANKTIGHSMDALATVNVRRQASAQDIIDALPERSQYTVLSSLVGSISCSIVGLASTMVGQLEKKDYEFHTLSALEVINMLQEPDFRMDRLHSVRKLMRVRNNYMAQFLAVANDNARDSWDGTLELMTTASTRSRIDSDRLTAALEACGIEGDTAVILTEKAKQSETENSVRSADVISKRRGAIEWLIEHVFNTTEYYDEAGRPATDHNTDDDIESLPSSIVERLYEKIITAVSRARDAAVTNFATGSYGVTLDDVMLCSQLIVASKALRANCFDEANV